MNEETESALTILVFIGMLMFAAGTIGYEMGKNSKSNSLEQAFDAGEDHMRARIMTDCTDEGMLSLDSGSWKLVNTGNRTCKITVRNPSKFENMEDKTWRTYGRISSFP